MDTRVCETRCLKNGSDSVRWHALYNIRVSRINDGQHGSAEVFSTGRSQRDVVSVVFMHPDLG